MQLYYHVFIQYRVLTACRALLVSSAFARDIRNCKNNHMSVEWLVNILTTSRHFLTDHIKLCDWKLKSELYKK